MFFLRLTFYCTIGASPSQWEMDEHPKDSHWNRDTIASFATLLPIPWPLFQNYHLTLWQTKTRWKKPFFWGHCFNTGVGLSCGQVEWVRSGQELRMVTPVTWGQRKPQWAWPTSAFSEVAESPPQTVIRIDNGVTTRPVFIWSWTCGNLVCLPWTCY